MLGLVLTIFGALATLLASFLAARRSKIGWAVSPSSRLPFGVLLGGNPLPDSLFQTIVTLRAWAPNDILPKNCLDEDSCILISTPDAAIEGHALSANWKAKIDGKKVERHLEIRGHFPHRKVITVYLFTPTEARVVVSQRGVETLDVLRLPAGMPGWALRLAAKPSRLILPTVVLALLIFVLGGRLSQSSLRQDAGTPSDQLGAVIRRQLGADCFLDSDSRVKRGCIILPTHNLSGRISRTRRPSCVGSPASVCCMSSFM
jgi:hypothetical protein